MRSVRLVLLMSCLLGTVLPAVAHADEEDSCGPTGCGNAEALHPAGAPALNVAVDQISYADLVALRSSDAKYILLDTRPAQSFSDGHIDGALSFPLGDMLPEKCKELLPQGVKIVVYCQSSSCSVSRAAAQALKSFGFKDVVDYHGGIKEWTEQGNKLVKD